MIDFRSFQVWFVTGSQHLYGDETLRQVADHSQQVVQALAHSHHLPAQMRDISAVDKVSTKRHD